MPTAHQDSTMIAEPHVDLGVVLSYMHLVVPREPCRGMQACHLLLFVVIEERILAVSAAVVSAGVASAITAHTILHDEGSARLEHAL